MGMVWPVSSDKWKAPQDTCICRNVVCSLRIEVLFGGACTVHAKKSSFSFLAILTRITAVSFIRCPRARCEGAKRFNLLAPFAVFSRVSCVSLA